MIITNLVHLLPNPSDVLRQCAELVRPDGTVVVQGHNIDRLPVLIKHLVGAGGYRKTRRFAEGGIQMFRVGAVKEIMRNAGLQVRSLRWSGGSWPRPLIGTDHWSNRFGAKSWILQAHRPGVREPSAVILQDGKVVYN